MQALETMLPRGVVAVAVLVMALASAGLTSAAAAPTSTPQLTLSKSAPASATVNTPFNYTISLGNKGTAQSTNTMVVDQMPPNTSVYAVNASQGSCTTSTTQKVTCSLGTVAGGGQATITITVAVSNAGPVKNTANASDTEGSTATASANTNVTAPVPAPGAKAPMATTGPATGITNTNATLTGQVVPGNQSTAYFFQYGTSTAYGQITPIGRTGTSAQNVSAVISNLTPGTVYHYRLTAINDSGTSYGADLTFKTTGTHYLGSLVLDSTLLPVKHGNVFVTFTCNSTKPCFGLFSVTARLRLANGSLATIVCTAARKAKYNIGAHRTGTVSTPLHQSCLAALQRHHGKLRGKLSTRPRTAQKGLVRVVTLVVK